MSSVFPQIFQCSTTWSSSFSFCSKFSSLDGSFQNYCFIFISSPLWTLQPTPPFVQPLPTQHYALSPASFSRTTIEFITSFRGKTELTHDGYTYIFPKERNNGFVVRRAVISTTKLLVTRVPLNSSHHWHLYFLVSRIRLQCFELEKWGGKKAGGKKVGDRSAGGVKRRTPIRRNYLGRVWAWP